MLSDGYIAVHNGPLRVNRSVAIVAHPASLFPPSFDCLGLSNLLFANVSHELSSAISLFGMRVRNGCSEHGGAFHLVAATVQLNDLTIYGSTATMAPSSDDDCSFYSVADKCLGGGGAIRVEAHSLSMEGVSIRDVSAPLSGGAINILDTRFVHLSNIDVRNAQSGVLGGAIAVLSSSLTSRLPFHWTVCNVTATNTTAGNLGGAVFLGATGGVSNSTWSVADVTTTDTMAGNFGGALALGAINKVTRSTWSVTRVTATNTMAGNFGGAVLLGVISDVSRSTWSVSHVTVTNSTAADFGGAVLLATIRDLSSSAWSVSHVTATNTLARAGDGGAISLLARHVTRGTTWSVMHVTATNTMAGNVGGAVALGAISDVSSSRWSVADVVTTNTTAGSHGGAILIWATDSMTNSTWSVARVTATAAKSRTGRGGVVSLQAGIVDLSSLWSVTHVFAASTTAGTFGGVVSFFAQSNISSSTWSVAQITAANTTASDGGGGAITLQAATVKSNSTWSVEHVIAINTTAADDGGAVFLLATVDMQRSSWEVSDLVATAAHARRGGVLSLQARKFLESTCSLSNVRMSASHAEAEGGGVYVSAQTAKRTVLHCSDWQATNLYAREGAVGAVSHAKSLKGKFSGLKVIAIRLQVKGARAMQGGGVWAIHSGWPYQISWRTFGRSCRQSRCGHYFGVTRYGSTVVPFVHAIRLSASEWVVDGVSATTGGLAVLDNVDASVSDMQVRNISASSSGGLWRLSGSTALSVRNLSATINRESNGTFGLLLDQNESPGNLSLSNVSVQLQEETPFDSGTQTWIFAGALTPTEVRSTIITCPKGATFHDASRGRLHLTQSPFYELEYTWVSGASLNTQKIATVKAFAYATTKMGCRVCPEGKYMFTRLAWVSSDMKDAVCGSDLDPNVTMPLCPNTSDEQSSCVECPTGATCSGGQHVTAEVGRWGSTTSDNVDLLIRVFPLLQFGYACSSRSCQKRFDSCAGNRTGFACGRCLRGFGEAFGSANCVAESDCRGWEHYTAWTLFPLGCFAVAAVFLYSADVRSDGVSSGLLTILFVLFQSEAIIRTHDEDKASTLSHLAMFQLSFPSTDVCLWPGMSARAKALSPLGTYFGVLAVLGFIYGLHWLLFRRSWIAHPPSSRRYRRALIALLVVSYGAIASVCLKLVTATVIDGAWYQSLTGDRWMQTPDQWISVLWLVTSTIPTPFWFWYGLAHLKVGTMTDVTFGLGLLFPIPAALLPWLFRRWHFTRDEKRAARDLHQTLAAPYSERFWYWDGVFLAQRLLLGLISVLLASDLWYRAFVMALFVVALALVYTYLHVFSHSTINIVNTAAMAGLLVVCFSNGTTAYTYQHGIVPQPDLLAVDRISTWSLRAVPIVAVFAKFAHPSKENGRWRVYQLPAFRRKGIPPGVSAPLMAGHEHDRAMLDHA